MGLAASGYCLRFNSCIRRGGRIRNGGNLVVVVVVVVTTVVCVAGAKDNCPSKLFRSTSWVKISPSLLRGLGPCALFRPRSREISCNTPSISSLSSIAHIYCLGRLYAVCRRASGREGDVTRLRARRCTNPETRSVCAAMRAYDATKVMPSTAVCLRRRSIRGACRVRMARAGFDTSLRSRERTGW